MTAPLFAPPGGPLVIRVPGVPVTQGSMDALPQRNRATGAPVLNARTGRQVVRQVHHNAAQLEPWRGAVAAAARRAMGRRPMFTGPCMVGAVFTMPRPQSHYRTGKFSAVLRGDAPARPVAHGKNDLDKLLRAVFDALKTGGVWADDSLAAELGPRVAKVWCGEDPDAFTVPGALITVREL